MFSCARFSPSLFDTLSLARDRGRSFSHAHPLSHSFAMCRQYSKRLSHASFLHVISRVICSFSVCAFQEWIQDELEWLFVDARYSNTIKCIYGANFLLHNLNEYTCACVCAYIYLGVYINVCTYTHIDLYICMHVHIY